MTELVNYGMADDEKEFIVSCLRDMGNHYHNLEREMFQSMHMDKEEPESPLAKLHSALHDKALKCVLLADKLSAGEQLVITSAFAEIQGTA